MTAFPVVVLGGGPAGVVAARLLAVVGWRVILVDLPRSAAVGEGASERVVEGLRRAGCTNALATIAAPVPRRSLWNGAEVDANREHLVDRGLLDAALLRDAAAAGIEILRGRVARRPGGGDGPVAVVCADGGRASLHAGFVVEARGRRAPRPGGVVAQGPASTALNRRWWGVAAPPGTTVAAFAEGWAWLAVGEDGRADLQVVLSGRRGALAGGVPAEGRYRAGCEAVPEFAAALRGASPAGPVVARSADAVLAAGALSPSAIRVGDAALAVDPLSGHGMFEAVSTAMAAVPVIRTLLERPGDAAAAAAFYRDRLDHAFYRHARAGRDFYAAERRWADAPFWRERAAWPDDRPAHVPLRPGAAAVESRPVVEDGFVAIREVVVTADHPRGVWQVDGVPLVPLLELSRGSGIGGAEIVARAAERLDRPPERVAHALGWLRFRGLLVAAGTNSEVGEPAGGGGPRGREGG